MGKIFRVSPMYQHTKYNDEKAVRLKIKINRAILAQIKKRVLKPKIGQNMYLGGFNEF